MRDVEMVPGMPAQTLIETGKSSVAFYAVRPLLNGLTAISRGLKQALGKTAQSRCEYGLALHHSFPVPQLQA